MPILNMNYGANKSGANIGEPTNLSATATSNSATITWTDNDLNTIPPATFFKSVLVRKAGSAPTSPSDGTTVVTETVKNTYSSNGYTDTGLTTGTTYYYQVFSYSDLGGITYGTPIAIIPSGRLPAEYQEVEWIGMGTNQYIGTGYSVNSNIQIETKIVVNSTGAINVVFGGIPHDQSSYSHLTTYNNAWYFGRNGIESSGGTYSPVIGTEYEIVFNDSSNNLVINNSIIGSTSGTTSATGNTLAINNRGNEYYGVFKYYYFKMYDKSSSDYIKDFVPCYRKLDSVIGLYDTVNNQFYTNSGTGTFTKGPDVN